MHLYSLLMSGCQVGGNVVCKCQGYCAVLLYIAECHSLAWQRPTLASPDEPGHVRGFCPRRGDVSVLLADGVVQRSPHPLPHGICGVAAATNINNKESTYW